MWSRRVIVVLFMSSLLVLCACGGKEEPTPRPAVPEDSAIRVTGAVAQEYGWTLEEFKAMDTIEVEAADRQGNIQTYTGVPITVFLDVAQPNAEATQIQFKADFGYVVDVPLADVRACGQCIVTYDEGADKLFSVMPGFDTTAQVDGLVKMFVK